MGSSALLIDRKPIKLREKKSKALVQKRMLNPKKSRRNKELDFFANFKLSKKANVE